MSKFGFLFFLVLALSIRAFAQFTDFPVGISGIPKAKLKGRVHTVLMTEQRAEKVFDTIVEVYDEKGRLIESMSSNAGIEIHSGTLIRLGGKTIYFYDRSGKLVKTKGFTPAGEYTGYDAYLYDAEKRLIETVSYDKDGKKLDNTTYAYFPEKREVLVSWAFSIRAGPMKNLLSYNEKEQWTKRAEYLSGASEITFEYDGQGNFVKEVHCCNSNYSHSYTYKFDTQGNWVERENTYFQPAKKDWEAMTAAGWMNAYRVITYYSDGEEEKPKK